MITLWHGGPQPIEAVDLTLSLDGGFHAGTRSQAEMRNRKFIHEIEVELGRVRRSRDTGGHWRNRARDAKARGFDAIVYLNRYEGIPSERFAALALAKGSEWLDGLSDAEFRRHVPEAQDSYILLRAEAIRIVRINDSELRCHSCEK